MLTANNLNIKLIFSFVVFIKLTDETTALKPLKRENDTRPLCSCGTDRLITTRVVGGHNAARGQFPYASTLLPNYDSYRTLSPDNQPRSYCGGTLITDKHVLTAAHCLKERTTRDIQVNVGDYDVKSKNESKNVYVGPAKITLHPDYTPPLFNNDIGIIELEKPVKLEDGIKAAWLTYPDSDLPIGTSVTVYGWGRLAYQGGRPDILQTLDLPVVDHDHCQKYFTSNITENMICAGGRDHEDACIGDSGSGLTQRSDDDYVLVGIVSFGKRCALKDVPGIYTKLGNYVNWVYNETMTASCQPCIASEEDSKDTTK